MRRRECARGTILCGARDGDHAGEKRWPERRGHTPVSREKKYSGSGDGTKRRVAMARPSRLLSEKGRKKDRERELERREGEPVGFPPAFHRPLRLVDRGIIEKKKRESRLERQPQPWNFKSREIMSAQSAQNGEPDERYGQVTRAESAATDVECRKSPRNRENS